MTRKDYVKFAAAIRDDGWSANSLSAERVYAAKLIARVCKADNPRFDADKFYQVAGVDLMIDETDRVIRHLNVKAGRPA